MIPFYNGKLKWKFQSLEQEKNQSIRKDEEEKVEREDQNDD